MGFVFQGIKNFFTYKEPAGQPFELLEKDVEGSSQPIKKPDIAEISKKYDENKGVDVPHKIAKVGAGKKDKTSSIPDPGKLSPSLQVNIEYMKQRFNLPENQDVIIREFKMGNGDNAFIIYIDGMVDNGIINQFVIPQLLEDKNFTNYKEGDFSDYIIKNVISINQLKKTDNFDNITKGILKGMSALFVDGACILIESKGFEKRSIDKPITETVVKGSQEAFTEDLMTNLTLLRRSIKNENLIIELSEVGKTNHDTYAIVYLKGIANPDLINEVKRRVNSIDTDLILGSGMLQQMIEENSFMLFPQMLETERPDRAASFLTEGKVIIIAEGTPFVLAMPITLFHLIHTSEDSFLRWQYGTFLRLIRLVGMFITMLLPGLYIAITLYHHEMIPTQLLLSIMGTEVQVPFPVIIEMLMLEISFELIREGGIRVPGVIGNTLGIVGTLILGQAAVAAGLVSPIFIIITSVTAIGSFVVPNYAFSISLRILRFIIIFFGAIAGFYGVSSIIVGISLLACSMKSFGVPFLSPIGPKTVTGHDIFIRYPTWKQDKRSDVTNTLKKRRQAPISRGWKKGKGGDNSDNGR